MTTDMLELKDFLKTVIVGAGDLLESITASSRELGPWCDAEINRHIENSIRDRFPGHYIVTEELDNSKGDDHETVWIVDPIDGSENFYRGLRPYSISAPVRPKRTASVRLPAFTSVTR